MNNKYEPSNGTEGEGFIEAFCMNCINECWLHNPEGNGKKCDILSRTMLYRASEDEYPEEWTYNEQGRPVCTAWVKWDWDNDGDPDDPDNPNYRPPDNPNQLCMPFIFDELEIPVVNNQMQIQ